MTTQAEKNVIGHALAYCHYIDYLGPRGENKQLNSLCKSVDKLRQEKKKGSANKNVEKTTT